MTTEMKLDIYTDSTTAIRDLRRVARATSMSARIHAILDTYPCPVRVLWIRRDMIPAHIAADRACRRIDLPRPLPLLQVSNLEQLLVEKENLRRATRALLPPRGTDLQSGLARWEEVLLRRLRVGVALSPAVTHAWPARYHAPFADTCPFCPVPATEADTSHLLWTCPALQTSRVQYLRGTGLHPGRPPDLQRWIWGPHYRSLLAFLRETNVMLYI